MEPQRPPRTTDLMGDIIVDSASTAPLPIQELPNRSTIEQRAMAQPFEVPANSHSAHNTLQTTEERYKARSRSQDRGQSATPGRGGGVGEAVDNNSTSENEVVPGVLDFLAVTALPSDRSKRKVTPEAKPAPRNPLSTVDANESRMITALHQAPSPEPQARRRNMALDGTADDDDEDENINSRERRVKIISPTSRRRGRSVDSHSDHHSASSMEQHQPTAAPVIPAHAKIHPNPTQKPTPEEEGADKEVEETHAGRPSRRTVREESIMRRPLPREPFPQKRRRVSDEEEDEGDDDDDNDDHDDHDEMARKKRNVRRISTGSSVDLDAPGTPTIIDMPEPTCKASYRAKVMTEHYAPVRALAINQASVSLTINASDSYRLEALLGQVRGDISAVPCSRCKGGNGIFAECVVVPGGMGDCCTCHYNRKQTTCDLRQRSKDHPSRDPSSQQAPKPKNRTMARGTTDTKRAVQLDDEDMHDTRVDTQTGPGPVASAPTSSLGGEHKGQKKMTRKYLESTIFVMQELGGKLIRVADELLEFVQGGGQFED